MERGYASFYFDFLTGMPDMNKMNKNRKLPTAFFLFVGLFFR